MGNISSPFKNAGTCGGYQKLSHYKVYETLRLCTAAFLTERKRGCMMFAQYPNPGAQTLLRACGKQAGRVADF